MFKRIIVIIVLIAGFIAIMEFIGVMQHKQYAEQTAKVKQLDLGISLANTELIMGTPAETSVTLHASGTTTVWTYNLSISRQLILIFENGILTNISTRK